MSAPDNEPREWLKHIAKISKDVPKPRTKKLTKDQQKQLSELDSKYGKAKKSNTKENGAGVGGTAELVLESVKSNYDKLFVDEYQNPHIAIRVSGHLETLPVKSKRFRN